MSDLFVIRIQIVLRPDKFVLSTTLQTGLGLFDHHLSKTQLVPAAEQIQGLFLDFIRSWSGYIHSISTNSRVQTLDNMMQHIASNWPPNSAPAPDIFEYFLLLLSSLVRGGFAQIEQGWVETETWETKMMMGTNVKKHIMTWWRYDEDMTIWQYDDDMTTIWQLATCAVGWLEVEGDGNKSNAEQENRSHHSTHLRMSNDVQEDDQDD